MHFSCGYQKYSEFNCGHYGTKMESVRREAPVKSYILPIEMGVAKRASSGVRIFFGRPQIILYYHYLQHI